MGEWRRRGVGRAAMWMAWRSLHRVSRRSVRQCSKHLRLTRCDTAVRAPVPPPSTQSPHPYPNPTTPPTPTTLLPTTPSRLPRPPAGGGPGRGGPGDSAAAALRPHQAALPAGRRPVGGALVVAVWVPLWVSIPPRHSTAHTRTHPHPHTYHNRPICIHWGRHGSAEQRAVNSSWPCGREGAPVHAHCCCISPVSETGARAPWLAIG